MPSLSCSVQNCGNNAEGCCCLNEIKVDGNHPDTPEGTCCNSFTDQVGASNSTSTPNDQLNVMCEATDCVHNKGCTCCADSIDVAGFGASNSLDTQCSSFCKS